jgi:hypothetical protein
MRISFVGSSPFPPRRDQAGTAIMVELGNRDRFFFDFGTRRLPINFPQCFVKRPRSRRCNMSQ